HLRRVAPCLAAHADRHHKLALLRELEDLVVIRETGGIVHLAVCVSHDPYIALVIHRDSVLIGRPLISRRAIPTPALNEIAISVKLHNRRCRGRDVIGRSGARISKTARPTQDPYVILGVDSNSGPKSHPPF